MVFSTLFTILRTGTLFILLNDYLKRTYPEKYDSMLIEIPLKLIYVYSKCQIVYTKLQHKINDFIETNPRVKKFIKDIYKTGTSDLEIEYIVNSTVSAKYTKTQSLSSATGDSFFIYSDLTNDKRVNKKIMQSEVDFNYTISNIQFIMVECNFELNSDTKSYKVLLKSELYNYYVINNRLDKKFFKYYLRNHTDLVWSEEEMKKIDKFSVKIIDQDVNVETFDITDQKYIIIEENNYSYKTI